MAKREVALLSFEFTDKDPSFTPRTPYYWMSPEELDGISKYPYILDYDCPFSLTAKIGENTYTFDGCVPKGFTYNLADIFGPLQYISYDRHSPFVKNASFIHDYMIARKAILYDDWKMAELGITPSEFRVITSEVFCHVLKYNGVPHDKAHLMTFFMNGWQILQRSWYSLGETETHI